MLRKRNRFFVLIALALVLTFLVPAAGEAGGLAGSKREGLWRAAMSWLAEAWGGLKLAAGLAAETGAATAVPDGGTEMTSGGKPIEEAKPARGSAIDPNGSR